MKAQTIWCGPSEKTGFSWLESTKWHRVICWNKFALWAGNLLKGAYVEVKGELRCREYTPSDFDHDVRIAEIYATSILALD